MASLTLQRTANGYTQKVNFNYTITTTDTTVTLTVSSYSHSTSAYGYSAVGYKMDGSVPQDLNNADGFIQVLGSGMGGGVTTKGMPYTKSWSRGTSSATHKLNFAGEMGIAQNTSQSLSADIVSSSITVSVPAKPSYAVSYNANGGSGAPSGQTKWYGETLTLQSGTPTRTNYVFKNWTTNQDGSGTSYNPSGSYTANSGATLYAQWYPPYTVTYKSNLMAGGADVSQVKVYNASVSLKGQEAFPREGFRIKEWNTSANGTGTTYAIGATYTTNADLVLYAIWVPWVEPVVVGEVTARRTDTIGDVDESDEGTCAYVKVPFTVKGGGSASYSVTVTLSSDIGGVSTGMTATGGWTVVPPAGSDPACQTHECLEEFHFSGLSTEASYTVSATVSVANTDYTSQQVPSAAKGAYITIAYFTMDVLGDGWCYNLTADTSVDPSKTYYTRSGSGTEESPYVYEEVETPVAADLAAYYEANGMEPGHGISFGAPAKREGFNVSMPQYAYERRVYPLIELTDSSLTTESLAISALDAITDLPRPFYAFVSGTGGFYRVS